MTLHDKIIQLLGEGKLGKALDLAIDAVKNIDDDVYNDLILLKARNASNQGDKNKGLMGDFDYKQTKNQIQYAFQELLKEFSKNVLTRPAQNTETDDNEVFNPTNDTSPKRITELSGAQKQELISAIGAAYLDYSQLEMFLDLNLDKKLADIAQQTDMQTATYRIITNSIANNWLHELLTALCKKSNNVKVKEFCDEVL